MYVSLAQYNILLNEILTSLCGRIYEKKKIKYFSEEEQKLFCKEISICFILYILTIVYENEYVLSHGDILVFTLGLFGILIICWITYYRHLNWKLRNRLSASSIYAAIFFLMLSKFVNITIYWFL